MKTRIIGAIAALVLAVAGAFVLINYVRGADARAAEGAELAEVYIVETSIPRGTSGDGVTEFVRVDEIPARNLAEGYVTDLADLAGLVADAEILPGEQLLEARFIDPQELAEGGDVPVPVGMQLVSFTLPADRVVGGQVKAGDHIGLVGTADPDEIGDQEDVINPISQFAFHGVLVTRVQGVAAPDPETGETVEQDSGSNLMLTIALSTHDVERWVWFAEGEAADYAQMWLTLENEADRHQRVGSRHRKQRLAVTPYPARQSIGRVRDAPEGAARRSACAWSPVSSSPSEARLFSTGSMALRGSRSSGRCSTSKRPANSSGASLDRQPGVGLIVVREQRSDLEDWVDELALHAVLARRRLTRRRSNCSSGCLTGSSRTGGRHHRTSMRQFRATVADAAPACSSERRRGRVAEMTSRWRGRDPGEAPRARLGLPAARRRHAQRGDRGRRAEGRSGQDDDRHQLGDGTRRGRAELRRARRRRPAVRRHHRGPRRSTPERTIVDAVAESALDELVLKTALTHHADGFFVVASAPSPELGDTISAAALGRLIEQLRAIFRYVVVDTTPGLGEHTLVALEHVTDAIFVTNMGVPSLRALRTEFELLTTLGLMPGNRHVVVNQTDKNSGITDSRRREHHRCSRSTSRCRSHRRCCSRAIVACR